MGREVTQYHRTNAYKWKEFSPLEQLDRLSDARNFLSVFGDTPVAPNTKISVEETPITFRGQQFYTTLFSVEKKIN